MLKKAEMGIGTLIVFISMILVAAIAAGVIVQTASSLQNKALTTGERSKSQVSTNLMPITMYAEDGESGSNVETFYAKVKLAPGSDPIDFSDFLIDFSLKNLTMNLGKNTSVTSCNETNGSFFTTTVLVQGNNYKEGYLQRGDVFKLCFESSRSVVEDEFISITFIPKIGNPTLIERALPTFITTQRVELYP